MRQKMSFKFIKTFIPGLYEIIPELHFDNRGFFFESYNQKDFFAAGLTMEFLQDNQSLSKKNVFRGLHFQKEHPQGKLIRCLEGKVLDLALDLRNGSETFGRYCSIILDSQKANMFYIPCGFAHGFYVLSDQAVISYKCSDFYAPQDQDGVLWNSKELNIDWEKLCPTIKENAILSDRDKNYKEFSLKNKYYDLSGKWIGN